MKKIVLGILAHVDSGKTTLSEAMLFESGNIKKMGRVDNKDATLDTHSIERSRGITIFSKQAIMNLQNTEISLLDTPGHTDFSGEMERTLGVLDYAILVINAVDGVQSHTETLWNLLKEYNVPTFIFINKIDLQTADKEKVFMQLHEKLDANIIDFSSEKYLEKIAESDEKLLEKYLIDEKLDDDDISEAISQRKIFPCLGGSALKLLGISEFLTLIDKYVLQPTYGDNFKARVFKILHDEQNTRLTYMKIMGGELCVKDVVAETGEKVQQIRVYQGGNFTVKDKVYAGEVCAVSGLKKSYTGQGFGMKDSNKTILKPILSYSVEILDETDPFLAYEKMRILADEDPLLSLNWNEHTKTISMGIMGEIQTQILQNLVKDRFEMDIDFDSGQIVYKETIANTVEGVGHFEPLRHYAEVRLLLEPLGANEGIILDINCKEENLSRSYRELVLTHLAEINHRGPLTGSFITDMKITLVNGRAHTKHTEGGDFRQATYRALQQGLRRAKTVLLEPFYEFSFQIPTDFLGKAIHDLDMIFAKYQSPEIDDEIAIIKGKAPVSTMRYYAKDIAMYTKGLGRISLRFCGYFKCHNQEEVIKESKFDYTQFENSNPDSVFCSHGSGFNVKWDKVEEYAHTEKFIKPPKAFTVEQAKSSAVQYMSSFESDKELMRIFEKTYGPIKQDKIMRAFAQTKSSQKETKVRSYKKEYLLVDGYNIIFAWENLAKVAIDDMELAKNMLINKLCNYRGFRGCEVILVFDAYKVKGGKGSVEKYHNINIIYTKEAETADMYIEKITSELARTFKIRVATSDALEQVIIFGHGAFRVSAHSFKEEIDQMDKAMREFCT